MQLKQLKALNEGNVTMSKTDIRSRNAERIDGTSCQQPADHRQTLSMISIVRLLILLITFFGSDLHAWKWMYETWTTSPDDSHGILVPAFSIWLLWYRRSLLPDTGFFLAGCSFFHENHKAEYETVQADPHHDTAFG